MPWAPPTLLLLQLAIAPCLTQKPKSKKASTGDLSTVGQVACFHHCHIDTWRQDTDQDTAPDSKQPKPNTPRGSGIDNQQHPSSGCGVRDKTVAAGPTGRHLAAHPCVQGRRPAATRLAQCHGPFTDSTRSVCAGAQPVPRNAHALHRTDLQTLHTQTAPRLTSC